MSFHNKIYLRIMGLPVTFRKVRRDYKKLVSFVMLTYLRNTQYCVLGFVLVSNKALPICVQFRSSKEHQFKAMSKICGDIGKWALDIRQIEADLIWERKRAKQWISKVTTSLFGDYVSMHRDRTNKKLNSIALVANSISGYTMEVVPAQHSLKTTSSI